jgi:acyl carrier protein
MGRHNPSGFNTLKCLLFGGQQVDVRWVRAVLDSGYKGRLLHVYGPTETTTFATWKEVGEIGEEERTIAIGRGIGNTEVYVLDKRQKVVPVGVSGELYIGGAGLARGYWKRAEMTAERFIPNPYSSKGGERLYRTGDVVRYLANGEIEFIGRIDEQVKIRGYRIELGEIEADLNQHESIAESVVLATDDESGDTSSKRLTMYVVGRQEQPINVGELHSYLREKLPDYMIPSSFISLDEMPLTPNGKVDRLALLAEEVTYQDEKQFIAPDTSLEKVLADIWADVLKREQIGINQDFSELGGHSLLATQVISRLREAFSMEIPLRLLFEAPTVAELSAAILQISNDPARVERSAELILAISQLSDDEAEQLLAEKNLPVMNEAINEPRF